MQARVGGRVVKSHFRTFRVESKSPRRRTAPPQGARLRALPGHGERGLVAREEEDEEDEDEDEEEEEDDDDDDVDEEGEEDDGDGGRDETGRRSRSDAGVTLADGH